MEEFAQEMKGCYDMEEEEEQPEEEEEEEEDEIMGETSKLPFSSSSSSSASPMYRGVGVVVAPPPPQQQQQQRMWLGTSESEEDAARSYDRDSNKGLEFVNLSLRSNDDEAGRGGGTAAAGGGGGGGCSSSNSAAAGGDGGGCVEREHMFDKVVTPSDVGKLNRLVIPKQHAEKYFPLDSSASDKGLLLNFEDRDGKPWRFRYSYWNSSQSYVMTKGWSRFVKEKKLDAGDIVSFQRGVGESGKDHLYIDWRRRPDAPDPTSLSRLHLPSHQHHHHHLPFSQPFRWGRLYSLPQSLSMNIPHLRDHMQQQLNYNSSTLHPYHHHHHHHHHQQQRGGGSVNHDYNAYYLSQPPSSSHQIGAVQQGEGGGGATTAAAAPVVINSVPVVKTTAKRLRLFGVNMECPSPDDHQECNVLPSTAIPHVTMTSLSTHLPSSSLSPLQLRLCNGSPDEFPKKGKTSLSFDLDI